MTALARYEAACAHGTTITGWRDIAAALERSVDRYRKASTYLCIERVRLADRCAADCRTRAGDMADAEPTSAFRWNPED